MYTMFIHTRGEAHSYLHTPSRLGSNISPVLILFSDKQGSACSITQRHEDFWRGMHPTQQDGGGEPTQRQGLLRRPDVPPLPPLLRFLLCSSGKPDHWIRDRF